MRHRTMFLMLFLVVVVAGCGNGGSGSTTAGSPTPNTRPSPEWEGYQPPPEGGGEISVSEFNQFIEKSGPQWSTSPMRASLEFLYGGRSTQEALPFTTTAVQETNPEVGTEATVTVTEEGLLDDAIAAVRFRLEFTRQDDGTWQLASAFLDRRCAREAEATDFTVEPCV